MSLIHFNVHRKGNSSKQYTIYDNGNKFLPCWHVPDLAYWHKQELHKQRNVNPGITPIITLMHELPEQCLCMCKTSPCWNCFFVHTGKWNLFIPSNKLRSSFCVSVKILILSLVNFLQAHVLPPFLGTNPISVQVSTGTEFRAPHSTKVKSVNTWGDFSDNCGYSKFMLEYVWIREVCYSHLLLSLLPSQTQYLYQENYFLVYGHTVIFSSREIHLKNYDAKRTFMFHIQCCNETTVKDYTFCPQILFHSSLECGCLVQWILNIFFLLLLTQSIKSWYQ